MILRNTVYGLSSLLQFTNSSHIPCVISRYLIKTLMEEDKFPLASLKECYKKNDLNGVLTSLLGLKKHLRGAKNVDDIDRETCKILINLIQFPNPKIMDISVSILANCCLKNGHREMFKELGGIPHLILILKTIDNDSILCRACRLLGNLAINRSLALVLNEYNTGSILLKCLETSDNKSPATMMMTLRAIKKLWSIKQYQSKTLPEDVCNNLSSCLYSTEEQLVALSVEILSLFSSVGSSQTRNGLKISKDLIARLVELSKKKEMTEKTINCLSNLICYQTSEIWKYLEGSGLPEIFINYIQEVDHINKVFLEAFYKLCTEGAVRNKVKASGLFTKLLKMCRGTNADRILVIFYLFQFDVSSIAILAKNKEFISLLIRNIPKTGAVRLLSAVSRSDPPVKELLSEEHLNVIIKYKECHGILRKISQRKIFLTQLIISGRIWEISKVNCLSKDHDQYTEALLVHLLQTGEKDEVENAALAVPFLVKPRHYTLYNILAHNNGITIILRLLKERTLEEKILATIVKLISIFKENFNSNYKHSRGFFEETVAKNEESSRRNDVAEDIIMDEVSCKNTVSSECSNEEIKHSDSEMVSFELDCGSLVTVSKTILCKNSPVLDAMLNGHFIESKKQKVRLSCCSREALLLLEELLKNETNMAKMSIETHLELISLTDRFLLSNLNDCLTVSLSVDQSTCVPVLQWCRNSGYSKNIGIVRKKAYDFVFSSSSHLLLAMKNDSLRASLVNEISNYLSSSFLDLL